MSPLPPFAGAARLNNPEPEPISRNVFPASESQPRNSRSDFDRFLDPLFGQHRKESGASSRRKQNAGLQWEYRAWSLVEKGAAHVGATAG
jgi:hypothetical protein